MAHAAATITASTDAGVHEVPRSERGPAPVEVVVTYGFWLFLLSDIIVFSAFFAAYAVLHDRTAGGPDGTQLFDLPNVLIETLLLLLSSFSCGMFGLAVERANRGAAFIAGIITFALGAGFVAMEVSEFASMIAAGAGPDRSAFLSAFFALVGLHGTHVSVGLLWLIVMFAQIATLGFTRPVVRRLLCFNLFWHALDIVWIGVFTIVYLGAGK